MFHGWHTFHPKNTTKFVNDYQVIKHFELEGFHHDESSTLEKSGLFTFSDKIYGQAEFGAEECFIGITDWGNGVICKETKIFFPSSWSKEKVINVILEANKNRIEELKKPSNFQQKFLCQGPSNLYIEVVIDSNHTIKSAYPSQKNFKG